MSPPKFRGRHLTPQIQGGGGPQKKTVKQGVSDTPPPKLNLGGDISPPKFREGADLKKDCKTRGFGHSAPPKFTAPERQNLGGEMLIFAVGVECGENRGRTGGGTGGEPGGEPGENRGCPKEPGENRGHLEENRGLLVFIYKEYRGRSGGFGTRTGGESGGGNFL